MASELEKRAAPPAATIDELVAGFGNVPEQVSYAVGVVRSAVLALDDLRAANPDDPAGLARLMQLVRVFERDLSTLRRQTEADATRHMLAHYREMEVPGLGYIKASQGRSRKVFDLGTVDDAIGRHARYDEDGEARMTAAAVAEAVRLTKTVYGGTTAKITPVTKTLGLDPDDVAEWQDGKPTLMLPPIPD